VPKVNHLYPGTTGDLLACFIEIKHF